MARMATAMVVFDPMDIGISKIYDGALTEAGVRSVAAEISRVAAEYDAREMVACDGCGKRVVAPWCQWAQSMGCLCQRVWCERCVDGDPTKFDFNPSHMMFYKCPRCDGPEREKADGTAV